MGTGWDDSVGHDPGADQDPLLTFSLHHQRLKHLGEKLGDGADIRLVRVNSGRPVTDGIGHDVRRRQ